MKNLHTIIEATIVSKKVEDESRIHETPFYATRTMFKNYLGYTEPLSFDRWLCLDDDKKAAVLYVQFFEQITLAWYKVKSFYTQEEDGVETVIQYLIKNVPLIAANKSKFRPAYIYRVAFNCLYCICHDIQRDRDRFELECSNIQASNSGDEYDLFDTVGDRVSLSDISARDSFWRTINELGLSEEMMEFVYSLADVNPPKRLNDNKRDVIEQLRVILAPYKDAFYI